MATRPAEVPRATGWPRARAARSARRRGKFSTLSISGAAALLVLVIAAWYLVTALTTIPTFVIPTPASVWRSLVGGFALPLSHPGGWWLHIGVTLREAIGGLVAGSVLGLGTGLLIAETRMIEGVLMPHIIAFQCMPKAAIAPLLVIWFGFGSTSKTLLAFIMSFFPVL